MHSSGGFDIFGRVRRLCGIRKHCVWKISAKNCDFFAYPALSFVFIYSGESIMERKGLTLIELLVVIAVIMFATGTLTAALHGSRQTAVRLVCETNLTGIGRAMTVFANENEGDFPRAGGPGGTWTFDGVLPSWFGGFNFDPDAAYGIWRDNEGNIISPGRATITSSLYLLVKYGILMPKRFVCKGDAGAQRLNVAWFPPLFRDLSKIFDFGGGGSGVPFPGELVSYAYHMPNSRSSSDPMSFAITDMTHPASPVCADRNPHLDKNATGGDVHANSAAHQGRGQNVLYKDGSVRFETTVTVGIEGDNIYTYGGDPNGTPPAGNGDGFPADEKDAYLVGEQNYML
jgi:type II secretory pathway pseudopilin PulG